MKRLLGVTLGILTAIGGFVDIGDLVTNALVGARFGMHLAWVVVVGIIGICLYAEMSGRIAGPMRLCLVCSIACSAVLVHPEGLRCVEAWCRSGDPQSRLITSWMRGSSHS